MSETPTLYPVGPSLIVRVVMAPLTKMLNPPVARLAGRRRFRMAAQIHHVGRRSGKPYVTSVGARVHKGTVLIPLTFGNRSDWARNVYRAGECSVRVKGTDYHAVAPQFVTAGQAAPLLRPMFHPVERLAFKLLGIRQFMRLQLAAR
jgi:deazaflavin-dependent oxidoreductase (nitroreductase family)